MQAVVEVFNQHTALPKMLKSAVAIGNFDGVHEGHLALIRAMLSYARTHALTPAVLTFSPHPAQFFVPHVQRKALMSESERLAAFETLGVELVCLQTFDAAFASMSPNAFIKEVLLHDLGAQFVSVGFDFRYGHQRSGNLELLAETLRANGRDLRIQKPVCHGEHKISSSEIRRLLESGLTEIAAQFLGWHYGLLGRVVSGDSRGRQLGYPTVNIDLPDQCIPANGVYCGWLQHAGRTYPAVANLGGQPTFGAEDRKRLEVHVLGINLPQIYGDEVCFRFLSRLRETIRFSTLDALQVQLSSDAQQANLLLSQHSLKVLGS